MDQQTILNVIKVLVDFAKVIVGIYLYKSESDPIYIFLYMFVLPFINLYVHQLRDFTDDYLQYYSPIIKVMYSITCELMNKDILAQQEFIIEFFMKVLLFNHASIQFEEKDVILAFFREPLTSDDSYVATQCFMEQWAKALVRYSNLVTESIEPKLIPYTTTTSQPVLFNAISFMFEVFYLEFFEFFYKEQLQNLISVENSKILQEEKTKFPAALSKCLEPLFENYLTSIDGVYQKRIKLFHDNVELNLYLYNEVKKVLGDYAYKGVLLNYMYNHVFLQNYFYTCTYHILESQPIEIGNPFLAPRLNWLTYYENVDSYARLSLYKFSKPIFFNKDIVYEGGFRYIEWYKPFNYSNGFTADSLDNISPFVVPVMQDDLL